MLFDLILRNAWINVDSHEKSRYDIGIAAGTITAIESHIATCAKREIDCSEFIVAPGLIDLHVHAAYKLNPNSLKPDEIGFPTGVTTVVDAGSVGALLGDAFCDYVAPKSKTNLLCFMNIALDTLYPLGLVDPSNVSFAAALGQLERHSSVFRGIKVMASVTHLGILGLEAVKLAKKVASLAGLPLMAHIGNAPPVVEDVLDLLSEGDVVTHCFHGKPGGLFDLNGKPIPKALAALERGVRFDIGHGSASFNYQTYLKAVETDFPFHVISTDLHIRNRKGPVFDLLTTMNKFLALGCSLEQVIGATTSAPASILGLTDRGGIQIGKRADLTVLKLVKGNFTYRDSDGNSFSGKEALEAVNTIIAGEIVWSA